MVTKKKIAKFITMKIRKNLMEGRSRKQAIAISLSQARKKFEKHRRKK